MNKLLPLMVAAVFALAFAPRPVVRRVPAPVPAATFRRLHAPSLN